MRPAGKFRMVRGFGFRLCCKRPVKSWITLVCKSDGGFLLFKTLPVVFWCAKREYEHESRCNGIIVLQTPREIPRPCWPATYSKNVAGPPSPSYEQIWPLFQRSLIRRFANRLSSVSEVKIATCLYKYVFCALPNLVVRCTGFSSTKSCDLKELVVRLNAVLQ